MTLPFKNDTSAIVNKLSNRSVKSDKRRIYFTVSTIAIAVTLIMVLLLSSLGFRKELSIQAEKFPQGFIYNVTEAIREEIEQDKDVEKITSMYTFEPIRYKNSIDLKVLYYEDIYNVKHEGNFPKEENEIMLSKSSEKYFNEEIRVGSIIALDLGKGTKEYRISGILSSDDRPNTINIYCSLKYLTSTISKDDLKYTVYIQLKNASQMKEADIKNKIFALIERHKISKKDFAFSGRYLRLIELRSINVSKLLHMMSITLVVLVAAALVIYNIFYIFIGNKIREYGQLRAIGMTQKQIHRMIFGEGRKLAIPGIIIGIIAGSVIGYIMLPTGWYLPNTILASMLASIFGLMIIYISICIPAKVAGNISPIEAVRYLGFMSENIKGNKRRKYHKASPYHLAFLNLWRNSKKTLITISSLGLCGILLISGTSLRSSISIEDMTRNLAFQYGDFKIEFEGDRSILDKIGGNAVNYGAGALQAQSNKFTEEMKQQLLSIDGVTGIKEWYGTTTIFNIATEDIEDSGIAWGYSQEDMKKINQKLIAGTADYEKLTNENGIVVYLGGNAFERAYHYKPKIGDKITLSFWQSNGIPVSETFTVMGLTDGNDGFDLLIRLPMDSLNKITKYNCALRWEVITDESKNMAIKEQLDRFIEINPDFSLATKEDYMKTLGQSYKNAFSVIYIFMLFIGLFGVINLINLMVTNQIVRKQENGIMLAVGMSRNQLFKACIIEGELLVVMSLVLATAIGTPVGYFIVNYIKSQGLPLTYGFPFIEYFVYAIALIGIEFFLAFVLSRNFRKQSLIEQISDV